MAGSRKFWRQERRGVSMTAPRRQWRKGKVRPLQGNSPHDRPVSRGVLCVKESLRRSLSRHLLSRGSKRTILRRLSMRFLRDGGIYHTDVVKIKVKIKNHTPGGTVPPPDGRPRAQVKERGGRTTPFSSFAMSSDRLILDRVARQHCPSPLHRHAQITIHPRPKRRKQDISTLQRIGHFYFALTHGLRHSARHDPYASCALGPPLR
jgi:hypothetical protein